MTAVLGGVFGHVFAGWFRQRVTLEWFAADPALARVSHEARWADVPPDYYLARAEYEDDA